MLTAGDALAKTLVKSQKVTFWSQKMALDVFFLLTAGDALMREKSEVGKAPLLERKAFFYTQWFRFCLPQNFSIFTFCMHGSRIPESHLIRFVNFII